MNKKELTQLIKQTAEEWIYDPTDYSCYWDLNSGSCGDFAFTILEKFPSDSGVVLVTTGDVLKQKGFESFGEHGEFSNHVWLLLNGEHFDAERPEGVKDFMELPFFQRQRKMKQLNMDDDRDLYVMIEENPTKYKEMIYLLS